MVEFDRLPLSADAILAFPHLWRRRLINYMNPWPIKTPKKLFHYLFYEKCRQLLPNAEDDEEVNGDDERRGVINCLPAAKIT